MNNVAPVATREQWLAQLVFALRPLFAEAGHPLPEKIRVACGWPSMATGKDRRRVGGEAWSALCSADGTHETFLSPMMADPIDVGAVLVHELVHHAVGVQAGHGPLFRACALAVGLTGPMRSTVATEALRARLEAMVAVIGPYPHSALVGSNGRKKQGTRMLKVTCQACECIVRMTRQWLEQVGAPRCGCGGEMAEG